jgi:hypothetical protein
MYTDHSVGSISGGLSKITRYIFPGFFIRGCKYYHGKSCSQGILKRVMLLQILQLEGVTPLSTYSRIASALDKSFAD